MRYGLSRRQWRFSNKPHAALLQVLLPLINGLSHNMLLRRGVCEAQYRLNNTSIHLYHCPSRAATPQNVPILLVHGIADNALTWLFEIVPLSRTGPVYALDLPGFGLSGCPAGQRYAGFHQHLAVLRELITTVIKRPPLIVGNSLGGWLAARLSLEAPELTRGIIMLDPGGAMLDGPSAWQEFVDTIAVPDLRTVRQIYHQMFGQVLLLLLLYLMQHNFQELFAREAVRQFVANATEADFLRPEELQQISVPVGLVWGLRDRFLPRGSLEFFRSNLRDPRVLLLPGCGHLPQRECPLQVIRFVRAFAQELAGNHAPYVHASQLQIRVEEMS